jgi:hypothetical protein
MGSTSWREVAVVGPSPACSAPQGSVWGERQWPGCEGRSLSLVGPGVGDVVFVCPVHDRAPGGPEGS